MRQSDAETLLQTLNRMKRKLGDWRKDLDQRTEFLDEQKQFVKQDIDYLQEILASAAAEDLPESLVDRLDSLGGQVDAARIAIRDRLDLALGKLSQISTIDLRIREYTQLLETRLSAQKREVFTLEEGPIWHFDELDSGFFERLTREFRSRINAVVEYIKANATESVAMAFFLLFLGVIGFFASSSDPLHSRIRCRRGPRAGFSCSSRRQWLRCSGRSSDPSLYYRRCPWHWWCYASLSVPSHCGGCCQA